MNSLLLLAGLWVLWGAVHSGLITPRVAPILDRRLGRFSRLVFNLIAAGTLVPVVVFERSLAGDPVFGWSGGLEIIRWALILIAVVLLLAGGRHYDFAQFLGLRQIAGGRSHRSLTSAGHLEVTGVLRLVRHPWYTATLLLVWCARPALDAPAVVTAVVLTVYLVVGTALEERKLIGEYGDAYRAFQKEVSMLLPIKFILRGGDRGKKS